MNWPTRIPVWKIVLVAGVSGFLFFFRLGAFGLVGADEPRYAQIAREMFQRHDWIIPTLNGRPWLEKPAFLYWKMMGSYAIFGVTDWAARIPSASHALALIVAVFFFMRRFRPGTEMVAALVTASSAAIIGFARAASTDMVLASHFAAAMLAWWAWHSTGRKLWLLFFYALLAFAALAKGPVAPGLAVLVVGAYSLLRRNKKIFVRSLWWPGFLLFFLIALPWYAAIQIKVPQFFRIFLIEQNLGRYTVNLYYHVQPFWYYVPVLLASMLPWTLFTILAMVETVRSKVWKTGEDAVEDSEDRRLQLFLSLWILVPVVFFSISRSKLPGYILPAIPAAALLTADYLHRGRRSGLRWSILLHAVICGGLVAGALLAPYFMLKMYPAHFGRLVSVVAGFAAVVVLMMGTVRRARWLPIVTLIWVVAIVAYLLGPPAWVIDAYNSARPLAACLLQPGPAEMPVSLFGDVKRQVEYGLNFYRNQPIGRYERDGVPQDNHIVIAPAGRQDAIRAIVGRRHVSLAGSFPPQHLEFFVVSNP
jgi:4-amino-4-deoxy-L-arabinose transferase-like glycosyltransferase